MNKSLPVILLILISYTSFAQEVYTGKPLKFDEVVAVDSISKNVLYDRAKALCVTLFNNPSEVIQIDDKEKGLISIKALESYDDLSDYKYKIHYTITIAVKDGRFKYEITDLILTGIRWSDFYSKWVETYNDIITDADLSERFFNERKEQEKKIKPDPTYVEFREKARVLVSALSSIIKAEMLKSNAITEQDW